MLPSSMQEAIRAKASGRKKAPFQDPYVKPKMSKEDFLAAKSSGAPEATSSGGGAADLSPLLQGQQRMLGQLQQLASQMAHVRVGGGGDSCSVPPTNISSRNLTEQLDKFKREILQSQRKVADDMVSQVEDIVRGVATVSTTATNKSSAAPSLSRLQHETARLKDQITELEEENKQLRKFKAEAALLRQENEQLRKQKSAAAVTSPTTNRSAGSRFPSKSANTAGGMQVNETSSAYEVTLNLPGISIADLAISYGAGALELKAKGKTYSYEVAESKINTSDISATLQPSGGLQISIPKKKSKWSK